MAHWAGQRKHLAFDIAGEKEGEGQFYTHRYGRHISYEIFNILPSIVLLTIDKETCQQGRKNEVDQVSNFPLSSGPPTCIWFCFCITFWLVTPVPHASSGQLCFSGDCTWMVALYYDGGCTSHDHTVLTTRPFQHLPHRPCFPFPVCNPLQLHNWVVSMGPDCFLLPWVHSQPCTAVHLLCTMHMLRKQVACS